MADYTDNALLASIKALEKVILPAVDPADPLAGEQLRLVAGFLKFLRTRLPHWQLRQVFELNHYLALAEQLAADARSASDGIFLQLASAIEQAHVVQRQDAAPLADIRAATAALSAPISALARAVATADAPLRKRVEHTILAGSRRWVDMQRTWFAPQGFELRPGELPPLESFFHFEQR
ncbi:hypothetical protein [Variovorax sp. dw_954]|uniref:hypothetical protein n=1 Tax=Variovorax sp. dw_954 TaxID=2720078 RepID=UPI001BD41874|nr:hypothetical protein [Variovorax sp. dw_954]